MHRALYNYTTPFLQPMIEAVSAGDREKAIRWTFQEIERPIKRLKRMYPDYTTPRDCKRLGILYLEGRVPKAQVAATVNDIFNEARVIGKGNKVGRDLAVSVGEGVSSIRTKCHTMRYIFYYLSALKKNGASDREVEKEAERMRKSYNEA